MINYAIGAAGIIELEVSGEITRDEILAVWARIDADLPATGKIKLIEIIGPIEGIELAAMWEDFKHGLPMMARISHAAIVADQRWITAISNVAGAFTSAEIRTFGRDDVAAARAWIAAA